MFGVVPSVDLAALVDVDLLLELLQGVLGAISKRVEASVHVIGWEVAIRHQARRRQGIVRREAVEWVGKHLDAWWSWVMGEVWRGR
jgi:hypothetical protein